MEVESTGEQSSKNRLRQLKMNIRKKISKNSRHERRKLAKATENIVKEFNELEHFPQPSTSNEFSNNNFPINYISNTSIQPYYDITSNNKLNFGNIDLNCSISNPINCSESNMSSLNSSICSSSSSSDESSTLPSLAENLLVWSEKHNITNSAITDLLHILKPICPTLPLDCRTLKETPRVVNIQNCCGGQFVYFGVESNIILKASSGIVDINRYPIVEKIKTNLNCDILTLSVNVDGLPLNKSNTKSFWPLLGILDQAVDKSPFLIAVFHGEAKPNCSNEFFTKLVNECIELEQRGITINGTRYEFRISCFIADAPARAFCKCTVSHNSLYGCDKCIQQGVWYGRTTWPYESRLTLRNDFDFANGLYVDYQQCVTVLTKLNIGLITQVPLDYMHLVCLGTMKRLITVWVDKGRKDAKLSSSSIQALSDRLLIVAKHTPKEFTRKPRALKHYKFWKATEFRAFLLYFGPVVLKDILSEHLYYHFLLLHVSIYLLCSNDLSRQLTTQTYANKILHSFVRFTNHFYGRELMLYNCHNLLHLVEDVVNYGPLDNFSAFPFENFMKSIKKMVRGPHNPLQQVAKRVGEKKMNKKNFCKRERYFNDYFVGSELPDNCFLTDDDDVVVIYDKQENDCSSAGAGYILKCKKFSTKVGFYSNPLDSSKLNIYEVSYLVSFKAITEVKLKTKCVLLPDFSDRNFSVCIPLCNSKCFF